jgi:hypothetical protein
MYDDIFFDILFFGVIVAIPFLHHQHGLLIESQFRPRLSARITFHESGVSGRRKKPFTSVWLDHFLDVSVTDRDFCIKGIWPIFTVIGGEIGLTFCIPLSNVRGVNILSRLPERSAVEISLVDEQGKDFVLALKLKRPNAFQKAISRVS